MVFGGHQEWRRRAAGCAALGLMAAGCAQTQPQPVGTGNAAHPKSWLANPVTAYLVVLVALEDHSPPVPAKDLVTRSLRALQANPRLADAVDAAIIQSAAMAISAVRPGDDDAYIAVIDKTIRTLAEEPGRPDVHTLTELAIAGLADKLDARTVFIPPCDSSDAAVRRSRAGRRGVDGVTGQIVRCPDGAAGDTAAARAPPTTQPAPKQPEWVFGEAAAGVIYLRLDEIGPGVDAELKATFDQLRAGSGAGASGVILDLRENIGGLSNESASIAGLLLPKGSLIGQMVANTPADGREYTSSHGDMTGGLPMVVLVSQVTAGGAELIAGALEDHHRALILGARTSGDGAALSQLLILGGRLFITTGFLKLPSGRALQDAGVQPDMEVSPAVGVAANHYSDPALRMALRLLKRDAVRL